MVSCVQDQALPAPAAKPAMAEHPPAEPLPAPALWRTLPRNPSHDRKWLGCEVQHAKRGKGARSADSSACTSCAAARHERQGARRRSARGGTAGCALSANLLDCAGLSRSDRAARPLPRKARARAVWPVRNPPVGPQCHCPNSGARTLWSEACTWCVVGCKPSYAPDCVICRVLQPSWRAECRYSLYSAVERLEMITVHFTVPVTMAEPAAGSESDSDSHEEARDSSTISADAIVPNARPRLDCDHTALAACTPACTRACARPCARVSVCASKRLRARACVRRMLVRACVCAHTSAQHVWRLVRMRCTVAVLRVRRRPTPTARPRPVHAA